MKTYKTVLLLIGLVVGSVQAWAQPTNNPYRQLYPDSTCHWTNQLPWGNVYNITDYTNAGTTWDARLEAAMTAASNAGGGVVFFPAGTYSFNNEVLLKDGVILRGPTPAVTDARDSAFAPPARLVFPKYNPVFTGNGTPYTSAFKAIRNQFEASNIGLVFLDINRAYVRFQPTYFDTVVANGYVTKWPAVDKHNVLVMGTRTNNAAFTAPFWVPQSYQNAWQRWSWYGVSNIDVHVTRNCVVANNRCNDYLANTVHPITDDSYDQPNYIVRVSGSTNTVTIDSGYKARFDYNAHYGITVNRFKTNLVWATGTFFQSVPGYWPGGGTKISRPFEEPTLFARGIEIKHNWVYQTERVAIFAAGQGLIIRGNVLKDDKNKSKFVSNSGRFTTTYNAFLENRGIDFSGYDVLVDSNDVEVYNHRFEYSNYRSNDGEGIMIQECCGGTHVKDYIIKDNTIKGYNAYLGLYKTQDINHVEIINNNLNNKNIMATANTNGANYSINNVLVKDNYNIKNIDLNGSKGGTNVVVTNNTGNGKIKGPCHMTQSGNTGFTVETCTPVPNRNVSTLTISPVADTVVNQAGSSGFITFAAGGQWFGIDSISLYRDIAEVKKQAASNPNFEVMLPNDALPHYYSFFATDTGGYKIWSKEVQLTNCATVVSGAVPMQATLPMQATVYPNPATDGVFMVEWPGQNNMAYRVVDVAGRLVKQGRLGSGQAVNLSQQPAGFYMLHLMAPNQQAVVLKLIKGGH